MAVCTSDPAEPVEMRVFSACGCMPARLWLHACTPACMLSCIPSGAVCQLPTLALACRPETSTPLSEAQACPSG